MLIENCTILKLIVAFTAILICAAGSALRAGVKAGANDDQRENDWFLLTSHKDQTDGLHLAVSLARLVDGK